MVQEIFMKNEDNNKSYLYDIGVTIYLLYFGNKPFNEYAHGETIFSNNLHKIEKDKDLDDLIKNY